MNGMTEQPEVERAPASERVLAQGVDAGAVVAVLLAAFGISMSYGITLLLPLFVRDHGGSEGSFGLVLSAAAIPAVVSLGLLAARPERFRPQWVLAASVGVFGAAAAGSALVTGGWEPLIIVGMLLGTSWAVVYTVMPMVINEMVNDAGRVTYFGYLTGTQQLGIGLGPVAGGWLADTSLGLRGTFVVAGVLCVAAMSATFIAAAATPDRRRRTTDGPSSVPSSGSPGIGVALRSILVSPVAPWMLVIALFACVFTTMTQFQTTFASARHLEYSIFYVSYTVAVIAVRFLVAPWAQRFDPTKVAAAAISVMVIAVAAFLVVGSHAIAYAVASAALGLGYGLALPTTQALAVSVAPEELRPRVLPVAGLVFQTAILGFPLAVGAIVVQFGYWLLFAVLIGFGVVQMIIAWRQAVATSSGESDGRD